MKKGLFVFALMFCCSLSAMAKVYNSGDLSPCDDKMCEQSGNLANGILKEYYENGKLKRETPYKNGVNEGIEKGYYESGNLFGEVPYKNGMPEGIVKEYYENGNLRFEVPYKNRAREGIAKEYYENGNLRTETLYKNDKKDGISKAYYENGKLKSEAIFKEGEAISGFIYNEETGEKREMSEKDLDFLKGRFRITGSSVKDKTRNFF
ncbi:MAG: toxin-antitoxin system YwqK family antitoxin [Alphaproteobacteria bacterium]|nr:toxin-antitoxin system YwqK family antitoxin [Alphaproteobacteria bacterium]